MPQALITVNASVGSNISLPINNVVQLNNQNSGGELTYSWSILDQPPGATDSLSSVSLQNPTFTPKKEGSYLIRLLVNQGMVTEQEDRVVCAVKQLKTLQRIPAAGETTEADSSDGWTTSENAMLRAMDALLSDPGIIVGVNASGGVRVKGEIVRATASSVIKAGLPGQETVPGFSLATAAVLAQIDELLAVVEGAPDGTASVANGGLMKVRYIGRFSNVAGAPAVGDTVYVTDAGIMSTVQGTIRRRVGSVMSVGGGFYDVWFNGVGGADIDLTPIDRAYLVHGNPGTLPNAIRTDGTNNTPSTTGFRFGSGAVGTVPLTAKGFAGQTANLFEIVNSTNTLLTAFDKDGDLLFNAAARRVQWPDFYLYEESTGEVRLTLAVDPTDYLSFFLSTSFGGIAAFSATTGAVTGTLFAGSTAVKVISAGGVPVEMTPSGVSEWRFEPGGVLSSINKDRIANIDRPTTAADAVSTEYFLEVGAIKNPVINSGFEFWQRGTTFARTHASGINIWDTLYSADRWYAAAVSDVAADLGATNVSRQTLGNGLTNLDYALRLGYAANGPGNVNAKAAIVQEIDRRAVLQLRGKTVHVSAWLRNVDFPAGVTYELKLVTGTGASAGSKYTQGYAAGLATVATTGVLNVNTLSTTFARRNGVGTVGANVTAMAVVLEITNIGNGGGATDGNMEIAEALLSESVATLLPAWERAAESYAGELDLCEMYYQKSYALDVVPGTAVSTAVGGDQDLFRTYFLNVSTASGAQYVLGAFPKFHRRMHTPSIVPAIKLYNAAGTIDQWTFGGGSQASLAGGVGETGFTVLYNGAGNYNPGAITAVFGHWTADADI